MGQFLHWTWPLEFTIAVHRCLPWLVVKASEHLLTLVQMLILIERLTFGSIVCSFNDKSKTQ